ncbi:formate dehydrogenase accessory sulfurtransferase FdhD [Acetobacteraceae bacterium H6797]|nr:formate dehydrogenase accessory sulfurtransferase FdhD [Acetobacteraceae bacterium H6797]
MTLPVTHSARAAQLWTADPPGGMAAGEGTRPVPEEVAVALTYSRETHAVMMATPLDLEDFGHGFSLTEGIIATPDDLLDLEIIPRPQGIEIRIDLLEERQEALRKRRRQMAGPVGCGLCGLDSLEAVMRPVPRVEAATTLRAGAVIEALEALSANQALHHATHAVHAAAFWDVESGLACLREDVGRHNALDKVVGAMLREGRPAARGAVVLTSRVSVEMVQKTAILGAPILIAVSAPTGLAVRSAEEAGMTLVARARRGHFDVYSHPWRILA